MASDENSGLPPDTVLRNQYARIYYLTIREWLIELYKELNGSLEWTGPAWQKFLHSAAFDKVVHEKMATLSSFTQEKIAYCDPVGELEEAEIAGGVRFITLPLIVHPRSELVEKLEGPSRGIAGDAFGPIGVGQVATRQFIKAIAQMFLKDVLKVDFRLIGRARLFSGTWILDEKLEYIREP
jgi:hypothetical protein